MGAALRSAVMLAASTAILAACVSAPTPPVRPATTQPRPTTYVPPAPVATPSRRTAAISSELERDINEIWRQFPGTTGISVRSIDGGGTIGERMDQLFPQQSVSKLWVAMTVLDLVDRGELRLDQPVRITRNDLAVFHQPIRDRVIANGEITESVLSLLEQAITASDNTANDSLLRTAGGPEVVNRFIARKKLGSIRFGPGERALQSAIAGLDWKQEYAIGRRFYTARAELPYSQRKQALDRYLADPIDGASPRAIANALDLLARGELLSDNSTKLLLSIMGRVKSGPNRLKAGVPYDWSFVHKTGTGQDLPPVSTGYNDIGIMTAPDGSRYAVVVMLGDTTASVSQRMQMMQSVTRAIARHHQR